MKNSSEKYNVFLGEFFYKAIELPTRENLSTTFLSEFSESKDSQKTNDTIIVGINSFVKSRNSFFDVTQTYLDKTIGSRLDILSKIKNTLDAKIIENKSLFDDLVNKENIGCLFSINYDTFIEKNEKYTESLEMIHPFKVTEEIKAPEFVENDKIRYYKIFGDISNEEDICATSQDIRRMKMLPFFGDFWNKLREELSERPTIFLGVNFEDLDFWDVCDFLFSKIKNLEQPVYIVQPNPIFKENIIKLKDRYGIKIICMEECDFLKGFNLAVDTMDFLKKNIEIIVPYNEDSFVVKGKEPASEKKVLKIKNIKGKNVRRNKKDTLSEEGDIENSLIKGDQKLDDILTEKENIIPINIVSINTDSTSTTSINTIFVDAGENIGEKNIEEKSIEEKIEINEKTLKEKDLQPIMAEVNSEEVEETINSTEKLISTENLVENNLIEDDVAKNDLAENNLVESDLREDNLVEENKEKLLEERLSEKSIIEKVVVKKSVIETLEENLNLATDKEDILGKLLGKFRIEEKMEENLHRNLNSQSVESTETKENPINLTSENKMNFNLNKTNDEILDELVVGQNSLSEKITHPKTNEFVNTPEEKEKIIKDEMTKKEKAQGEVDPFDSLAKELTSGNSKFESNLVINNLGVEVTKIVEEKNEEKNEEKLLKEDLPEENLSEENLVEKGSNTEKEIIKLSPEEILLDFDENELLLSKDASDTIFSLTDEREYVNNVLDNLSEKNDENSKENGMDFINSLFSENLISTDFEISSEKITETPFEKNKKNSLIIFKDDLRTEDLIDENQVLDSTGKIGTNESIGETNKSEVLFENAEKGTIPNIQMPLEKADQPLVDDSVNVEIKWDYDIELIKKSEIVDKDSKEVRSVFPKDNDKIINIEQFKRENYSEKGHKNLQSDEKVRTYIKDTAPQMHVLSENTYNIAVGLHSKYQSLDLNHFPIKGNHKIEDIIDDYTSIENLGISDIMIGDIKINSAKLKMFIREDTNIIEIRTREFSLCFGVYDDGSRIFIRSNEIYKYQIFSGIKNSRLAWVATVLKSFFTGSPVTFNSKGYAGTIEYRNEKEAKKFNVLLDSIKDYESIVTELKLNKEKNISEMENSFYTLFLLSSHIHGNKEIGNWTTFKIPNEYKMKVGDYIAFERIHKLKFKGIGFDIKEIITLKEPLTASELINDKISCNYKKVGISLTRLEKVQEMFKS